MLRIVVLVLLGLASPAYAQLTVADLEDDAKRLDTRYLAGYERAMTNRDFIASLHDSIYHPEYKAMKAARAKYDAAIAQFRASLKRNELGKASKELEVAEAAAEAVGAKTNAYATSSEEAVQKIYIGLGVGLFLIGSGVVLLIRRRRKR